MTVMVQIPQILRKYTNGAKGVEVPAGTVREALEGLDRRFPGLRGQILTPDGELHRFVNLYVNEEDVRYLGKLDTPLNNGDALSILPAVAGGSPEAGAPIARVPSPALPGAAANGPLMGNARRRSKVREFGGSAAARGEPRQRRVPGNLRTVESAKGGNCRTVALATAGGDA